ncbi:MAG: hypothetical protein HQL40_04295 [Alphaproteobacteria bacterium]|nr:hypothetical protein [Alphaproteobacteria bacterium]
MGRVDISAFEVGITHRRDGELHVFTSTDVDGLMVTSESLEAAIAELPKAVERLLSSNYGLKCRAGWSAPFTALHPVRDIHQVGRSFAFSWEEVYHHHLIVQPVSSIAG